MCSINDELRFRKSWVVESFSSSFFWKPIMITSSYGKSRDNYESPLLFKRKKSKTTLVNRKFENVVSVVSYESALWMPNKRNLGVIKNVQRKAVAWIPGPNRLTYKDNFTTLVVLPLITPWTSLIPITWQIMNGNINIRWTKFLSRLDYGGTGNSRASFFVAIPIKLRKCESELWYRTCQLANFFNEYFEEEFLFNTNHKSTYPSLTNPFSGKLQRNQSLHLANIMWLQDL